MTDRKIERLQRAVSLRTARHAKRKKLQRALVRAVADKLRHELRNPQLPLESNHDRSAV